MNLRFIPIYLLIAALSAVGCGVNSQSQGNQSSTHASGTLGKGTTGQTLLPGGYADASTSDAGVVAAANFAATEQSKSGTAISIKSIELAQQQVVAGMNYRVEVIVDEAGNERKAEAVVYQDLQQNYSLTSWTWK